MAGRWELPGGKINSGESNTAALRRELHEELGIIVKHVRPLIRIAHQYPDRCVMLHTYRVLQWQGQPFGREGQATRWVHADRLHQADLLEADRPIVSAVQLPCRIATLSVRAARDLLQDPCGLQRLRGAREQGVGYVMLDSPTGPPIPSLAPLCAQAGLGLILAPEKALPASEDAPGLAGATAPEADAAGLAVHAAQLAQWEQSDTPPAMPRLLGVRCGDAHQIARAHRFGADFVVLQVSGAEGGPALNHWSDFAVAAHAASVPVYAAGTGLEGQLTVAWEHGAQGIVSDLASIAQLNGAR